MLSPALKLLAVLLSLTLCAHHSRIEARTPDSGSRKDWVNHGGGVDQGSYSVLAELTPANINRLGLSWSLDLDGEQSLEATPLAVNGVLYFTGSTCIVYAVEAATGHLLWKYDPHIDEHMPSHMRRIFPVNRGVGYSKGTVYVGTLDGRLIALEAATGRLRWSVDTIGEELKNTITGAPLVFGNKVLIGNGGADWAARGYVTAFDARTGKQLWRFYTVPGNPDAEQQSDAMRQAAATWGGRWWEIGGGGGTVWDGMTYDPELDRVYIGVGNSGPYDPRIRSPGNGDNLFLASIVALDADTGRYLWHYQVNPREAWDYKATANMVLATLRIDGRSRKVLMQNPTNGFFYVLDRETGKLISAEKVGKVTWADHIDLESGRPVEAPNIRYETGTTTMWPSPYGTHDWQSMAYSPSSGLVYIPYMQMGATWLVPARSTASASPAGQIFGGVQIVPVQQDSEDGTGALLAWDPVLQKARWKAPHPHFWNGGVMVTAGGIVFQGDAEGQFAAYDATTGKRLWSFDAKLGIVAAPISYQIGGHQYVSILVGYGGATAMWSNVMYRGWKFGLQPRRLLTFALNGKATLPATPPPDPNIHPVDDPELIIEATAAAAGASLYAINCAFCHGANLLSAGAPAPDLRESHLALQPEAFQQVVKSGALSKHGMPRFEDLSAQEITELFMYVRASARQARIAGGSSAPGR